MSGQTTATDIATTDVVVEGRGVEYVYDGGTVALGGVDVGLERGKITAIIGPSGCGKSTLLAIIAGLLSPSAGAVEWQDGASDPAKPRLTLVFQKDTLLPWLTVEKNVGLGLRYLRLPKDVKRERVGRLVRMGGLEDFSQAYPRELSGGMRRRVGLLAGIAPLPKMLMLDEPFSGLDEPTRVVLHQEFLTLVHEFRMSVLLVTHDLAEALTLADHVIVLSRRPATVVREYDIDLGRDRDVLALRETNDYQELYRELWHQLRRQMMGHDGPREGDEQAVT